jgi:hypothetical protein
LSTNVFPAGAQQLLIRDHVIVANPARVVVLVRLLRRQIIQNHVLRLSAEARNEKADRLYDFITSPACADLLDRIDKLTDAMVDLDRTETASHQKTWAKRDDLIRGVRQLNREFAGEVDRIIGVIAPAHTPIE